MAADTHVVTNTHAVTDMHAVRLPGRTALVTGATSGIGAATAMALGRAGAHVLVSGRDEARGAETCRAVEAAGGRATLLLADLTDVRAVSDLARSALETAAGKIDILVNCAGGGLFKLTAEVTPEEYDAIYALNARAPFFLTAAIAPTMAQRGDGVIVNMASIGTAWGIVGLSLFSSAKASVAAMTRNWAAEYGPSGVRVNTIDVGAIETPVNLAIREVIHKQMAGIPARRMGSAEEVAAVVVFLATPAARYVQGATIPVDGGFSITSGGW